MYLKGLNDYLKKIKNIERIDFLPYHKMGEEKYRKLNISYPYSDKEEMNKEECKKLYNMFMEMYKENE